ncbi:hypothetical protein SAMN04515674_101618 [Pseudarcicella hirudinis]|uniref:Lipocalin-like domain-containing protein n=1 Tax=Pseudarcicella hirudinis TaxID=1079859 RepID=A0A1I5N5R6_9BACT|nr:hypothetical protein [Pseudarcicella hirudinis]SFP17158.1 hypothetical protein SAMN04515674_101618 [Pseudarcicella hirudinis]
MNQIKLCLFSFFLILLFSCKNDNDLTQNSRLIGKWKLAEVLFDPGNGSGRYQTVTAMESSVLEFEANGDFSEIKGPTYSSVNPYNRYRVLDDKRIELSMKNDPDGTLKTIWYYANPTANTLVMGYGCLEACSGKYTSIREK